MASQGVLLIDHGDLPSLAAVALQPDRGRLVLWHPRGPGAAADRRLAAVREHGSAFGVRRVVVEPLPTLGTADAPSPAGLDQAHLLLHGVAAACRAECSKIVWPQQVGPDARLVGQTVERANMVLALARLDTDPAAGTSLAIDLPIVDLADMQLVDLAEDCGAPLRAYWPCDSEGEEPCGSCPGCQRWLRAFDEAGVAWPWAEVSV